METIHIYQVDAFTAQAFSGNPAAVCILQGEKSDAWLQSIAAEMNLAETAFLLRKGESAYSLRWFTPTIEVSICGHATLASAHILWELGDVGIESEVHFSTLAGVLVARKQEDWIQLSFPVDTVLEVSGPANLVQGLGIAPVYVGQTPYDYLIEVASEREVRELQPDFATLEQWPVEGVIVTSRADKPSYDFVSRYFAPSVGIYEDPVSGAAHCSLAYYWATKLGKDSFLAYQASSRGGVVKVSIRDDKALVSGQAVTVMEGRLLV